MSNAFGLVVRFTLRENAAEAFDKLAGETVEQIRANEPGTLIYITHAVHDHADQRIFYELYANRAAFDTHEQQHYVRHFLAEREQYLATVAVDFLTPINEHARAEALERA